MLLKKLLGMVLLALALSESVYAADGGGPEIGQSAPNIIGRALDDQSYRLRNDKGSPKVVNFFWVGCVPCREEMPELGRLAKQFPKVKFISVHTKKESPENIDKFLKSLPDAPANIVLTSGGMQEAFKFLGLPHTVVMDSDNVVLMNLVGYTPENMLRLNEVLQKIGKQ